MSKAFINEDASSEENLDLDSAETEDAEIGSDGDSKLPRGPGGAKNYITQKGMQKLKDELHELLAVERPKLVETVAWAASNGDRSENADYIYGKRRLREIDRRIRFLQKRLDIAVVVEPSVQKGEKVLFGATVTVRDENDCERVYRIVGIDETDAKNGKVSWVSPVGKALLQAQQGDFVTLKTPKGEEDLEILKVQYIPLE
jgi:transcription elongation factor GreB